MQTYPHPGYTHTTTPLQVTHTQLTSHIHPGRVSPQSRFTHLCLTSIQEISQLNTSPQYFISAPYRHHIRTIWVSKCAFLAHLNPDLKNIVSPPSMHLLTSIQVHRFPSHIQPGDIWTPSTSHRLTSRIHPDLNPGFDIASISPPSRWFLTSI